MIAWLKYIVDFWLMPLPLGLTTMCLGALLLLSRKRARLGQRLLVGGLLVLLVFSNRFVSRQLIQPLELRYPPIPELSTATVPTSLAACRYVVVLGGSNGYAPGVASNSRLSAGSLARLVEAVRLLRVLPEAKLVLCGPTYGPVDSNAAEMARTAGALGVTPDRILKLERPANTEEEAEAIRHLVGDAPLALVTSAWHMPRATALVRHQGINALPCPTHYATLHDGRSMPADLFWDQAGLERSTRALHERLSHLWSWLRGKT